MAGEASRQKSAGQANIELVYNIRVRGFAGTTEVDPDPVMIGPQIDQTTGKFPAVISKQVLRCPT
jgi:hypothetical protein